MDVMGSESMRRMTWGQGGRKGMKGEHVIFYFTFKKKNKKKYIFLSLSFLPPSYLLVVEEGLERVALGHLLWWEKRRGKRVRDVCDLTWLGFSLFLPLLL